MFVGDKTRLGERGRWIKLSVENTAQATTRLYPIFMQGTRTLLAFLLILPITIKRQVSLPHELKKRPLTSPFLYWGNEIYIRTTPNTLLPFKAWWLPLTDAMTRGAFGNSMVPVSFWGLTEWGGRKAQKPFLASLFFFVTSLRVQWISN